MDYSGSCFKTSRRFVPGAIILAFLPLCLARGQEPLPGMTSGAVVACDPRPDEIAGLRKQLDEMQQRLQSQQMQLDQQAIRFQQLGATATNRA